MARVYSDIPEIGTRVAAGVFRRTDAVVILQEAHPFSFAGERSMTLPNIGSSWPEERRIY